LIPGPHEVASVSATQILKRTKLLALRSKLFARLAALATLLYVTDNSNVSLVDGYFVSSNLQAAN
jgi:hypothetical protein